jgi:exosortase A
MNKVFLRLGLPVCIFAVLLMALYADTASSLVLTWYRSGTYAHGFLILPISLWLTWEKRSILANTSVKANFWVILFLPPVAAIWVLAQLIDVLVVQQLALVSLLVLGIWAIVGNAVVRVLSFPLFFLFLGVPMGEDLVAPLMEFTASSTVKMIQMTGIPVYREGMFFSLPSGNWSVVEACSGVRYLIASFTLGLLYAYLTYRSLSKRLLFILAAILVPIAANSLRAYGIVMLGHLSGMTVAVGVDHLIYGWIFFGFVMVLLFWFGSLWREDNDGLGAVETTESASEPMVVSNKLSHRSGAAVVVVLAVASVGPLFVAVQSNQTNHTALMYNATIAAPAAADSWALSPQTAWSWRPVNAVADRELVQFYQRNGKTVALYISQYYEQSQGSELAAEGRRFFDNKLNWKMASQSKTDVSFPSGQVEVDEVTMRNRTDRIQIWSWYRVGQSYTANLYATKMLELWEKLNQSKRGASRIVLAVNVTDGEDASAILQSFLDAHLAGISTSLDSPLVE